MEPLIQLSISLLTGAISGFLASVPVGPINVTILNDGAKHGFRKAWFIGLGACLMEMIYCGLSVAGLGSMFESRLLRAAMELASFLFLFILGIKYLRAQSIEKSSRSERMIEERLHPHTAFMVGFVRVLGNPAVLFLWLTVSATFISHEWVDNNALSKAYFVGGVGLGTCGWFTLLSFGVARGRGKFSSGSLLKLSRVSGAFLLIGASVVAIRLVKAIASHHL